VYFFHAIKIVFFFSRNKIVIFFHTIKIDFLIIANSSELLIHQVYVQMGNYTFSVSSPIHTYFPSGGIKSSRIFSNYNKLTDSHDSPAYIDYYESGGIKVICNFTNGVIKKKIVRFPTGTIKSISNFTINHDNCTNRHCVVYTEYFESGHKKKEEKLKIGAYGDKLKVIITYHDLHHEPVESIIYYKLFDSIYIKHRHEGPAVIQTDTFGNITKLEHFINGLQIISNIDITKSISNIEKQFDLINKNLVAIHDKLNLLSGEDLNLPSGVIK